MSELLGNLDHLTDEEIVARAAELGVLGVSAADLRAMDGMKKPEPVKSSSPWAAIRNAKAVKS